MLQERNIVEQHLKHGIQFVKNMGKRELRAQRNSQSGLIARRLVKSPILKFLKSILKIFGQVMAL